MAFQRYEKGRVRRGEIGLPYVNVGKTGYVTMPKSTREQLGISERYVEMYFDPDSERIGLKFLTDATLCTYRVTLYTSGGLSISARKFSACYGIVPGAYKLAYDAGEKMFVAEVKTLGGST